MSTIPPGLVQDTKPDVTGTGAYTQYAGNTSAGYTEKPGQVQITTGEVPVPPIDPNTGLPQGFALPGQSPPVASPPPATTPPPPATTPPPPSPADAAMTTAEQSAWDTVDATLRSYGFTGQDLQSLDDFVKTELIAGADDAKITTDLGQTAEFARRFPAIIARQKAGLPPVGPAEYISLERQYSQLERAAGLPPDFTDQSHYDTLIANDVSPTEYSNRIQQGYVAMLQAPKEATQALQDYYGITQGAMAAYFLDPNRAAPILQQQAQAAIIGGAGITSGFGEPTADQAMTIARLGVSGTQAAAGFGDLVHQSQLTGTLPGQSQTAISADQLIGAEFAGDQTTKDLLTQRAAQQKAAFAGNTAFAATQSGVTGLGAVVR